MFVVRYPLSDAHVYTLLMTEKGVHLKSGCSSTTGKSVSMRVAFWWGPRRPPLSSSLASWALRATSSSFSPSLLWQLPLATTCNNNNRDRLASQC